MFPRQIVHHLELSTNSKNYLTQLISEPTRVNHTSQTTIDLIMVSDKANISQHGVIPYGISDHFMTFCTRKVHRETFSNHKTVKMRSLKNYCVESFKEQ